MNDKSGKTIRGIFYGVGIAVLLGLSCIAGICIEREHQKRLELRKEHVTTVAVVNMDDGVTVGSEQINYASQLISFPGENFTVTGLTDAKAGIENGTYAAYIIIPETFSASVTSIENDPKRVVLEYQYNPNLDETIQIQVMSDVNAFITVLNSNIAYMYVDAVLTEFHRIQDDSSTILANDNSELERLESVNAELLIEAAAHVEEVVVNNDIEPVELSSYTTQNDNLLDSLILKYMEASRQAQDDYAVIQETREGVDTAADSFFSTYNSVVYDTNSEQANILSEGRTSLADAIGLYNRDASTQREELERLVAELIDTDEEIANEQLDAILDGILDALEEAAQEDLQKSLDSYQTDMERWLETVVNAAYAKGYHEALTTLNNDINTWGDNNTGEEQKEITVADIKSMISNYNSKSPAPDQSYIDGLKDTLKSKIKTIVIHWNSLVVALPEEPEEGVGYVISLSRNYGSTVDAILGLFQLEYNPDEVNEVIQTYFVDKLRNVHQGQMARLEEAEKILYQNMDEYEARLENYDPLSYVRDADLGTYIDNIENNARGMLDAVEQNNSEYRTYAAEVYYTTSEHTSQLIDSLNAANTQTTSNIENCIDDLKLSRLALNNQNVSMLEGFTEALAYTRVGSQGNAEVYDYIVNPVVSRSTGEVVSATDVADTGNEISVRTLLIILLGIGIAASLAGLVLSIRWQYKKRILT